jgi:hypothetical protein
MGTHLVEKDKWSHHAPLSGRKCPSDFEVVAQFMDAWHHDDIERACSLQKIWHGKTSRM